MRHQNRKEHAFLSLDPGNGRRPPDDNPPPRRASARPLRPDLALLGFVGLCLLVGASNGALTQAAVRSWYLTLVRPPLTPPGWAFGPVWTALYVLIGVAGWLAWRQGAPAASLLLWGWQLLANAVWPIVFFVLRRADLALVTIVVLLALILATVIAFARASRPAAWLLVPYLAWVAFAAYLNAGFWWLNRA
jgi:tryptophan-rich sensory protein